MFRLVPACLAGIAATICLAQDAPLVLENRDFRGAAFLHCDLTGARLDDCTIGDLRLSRARGDHLTLEDCELRLSLAHVTLDDVRAERLTLTDARLEYCTLRSVTLQQLEVRDLRLERAELRGSRWERVEASDGYFSDCSWRSGDFRSADFEWSRFDYGSFRNARFYRTDLSYVSLENCDICGLTINGVRIDELLARGR